MRKKRYTLEQAMREMDDAKIAIDGLSGVLKQLIEAGFSQPAAEAIVLQVVGVQVTYVISDDDLEDS